MTEEKTEDAAEQSLPATADTLVTTRQPGDAQIEEFERLGEHSLAATLLFRMGIPLDPTAMQAALGKTQVGIDLEPPYTAQKITGALAAVALKIASGHLQPQQANALLFALQTLIGAVRVSIAEEKWNAKKETEKKNPNTNSRPRSAPTLSTNGSTAPDSPPTPKHSHKPEQRSKPNAHPKS